MWIMDFTDTGWGKHMSENKCKRCGSPEVHKTTRGLCRTCYRQLKSNGELNLYPVMTNKARMYERMIDSYGDGFICALSKIEKGITNQNVIAMSFGITRQRVNQIVKNLGGYNVTSNQG